MWQNRSLSDMKKRVRQVAQNRGQTLERAIGVCGSVGYFTNRHLFQYFILYQTLSQPYG